MMRQIRLDHGLILAGVVAAAVAALLLWGSPLLLGVFSAPVAPTDPGPLPVVAREHGGDPEAEAHAADLAVPIQIPSRPGGH